MLGFRGDIITRHSLCLQEAHSLVPRSVMGSVEDKAPRVSMAVLKGSPTGTQGGAGVLCLRSLEVDRRSGGFLTKRLLASLQSGGGLVSPSAGLFPMSEVFYAEA